MPYLRLSTLPLDEATKRHLADELTSTVLDVLPNQRPEWTTVHFTPLVPGDIAIAGRLVSDGATAETHLDLVAFDVDDKAWFALRNRLTDVLVDALGIDAADRRRVTVRLDRYDPQMFSCAGMTLAEIFNVEDDSIPEAGEAAHSGGSAWRRPAVLIGFGIGAYLGYRWFASRVGTDVVADAAPPVTPVHDKDRIPDGVVHSNGDGTRPHEPVVAQEY